MDTLQEDIFARDYRELTQNEAHPSMVDFFEKAPYVYQEKIVRYLKNGHCYASTTGRERDVFTGEIIPKEIAILTDAVYFWDSLLYHYVEKYNLRLEKEFEQHILRKLGILNE